MFLLSTQLFVHFLVHLFTVSQCRKTSTTTPKLVANDSNLLDMEIANSLNYLFGNVDEIHKQLSGKNETTTLKSTTALKSMTIAPNTVKTQTCITKVTALTNILFDSPTLNFEYWLLKPKVGLKF